ncbi:hypothetical protein [Streptomyces sp. NPDC057623]|uniref:hypothetical protein n=1 Tax=Streptomyces sp. NPDC057623 TaxID=3346187 RepID=UPI0036C13103
MTTETTDSITKGMQALAAMETHAAHLSEVAARLLTEHSGGLPELLAVRAEATQDRPHLALQPLDADDAQLWARALNVDVTVRIEDGGENTIVERATAEFTVDGVTVRIGSCQWYSAKQWAERIAEAVAA